MSTTVIKIGPLDQGRRMTLADFDEAEGQEGYRYELSQGVIQVVKVPRLPHFDSLDAAREQFYVYKAAFPKAIHHIGGSGECKIQVPGLDSERHPDLAIYKKPPPRKKNFWAVWIPDIAIDIVSPDSRHRDDVEKRDEYLRVGVREYWIIDAERREMLVLRRSGNRWTERVVRPGQRYRTRLLPSFEFACGRVF
jgi:Uma2 family endonuclease